MLLGSSTIKKTLIRDSKARRCILHECFSPSQLSIRDAFDGIPEKAISICWITQVLSHVSLVSQHFIPSPRLGQILALNPFRPVANKPPFINGPEEYFDLLWILFMTPAYGATACGTEAAPTVSGRMEMDKLRRKVVCLGAVCSGPGNVL